MEGGSGRGLFPLTALLSHSCRPNLLHRSMAAVDHRPPQNQQSSEKEESACDGLFMAMKAQRPIQAGQEVTISYIDPLEGMSNSVNV